jgi:hypothetical protein
VRRALSNPARCASASAALTAKAACEASPTARSAAPHEVRRAGPPYLDELRHARLLIRIVKRQSDEPTDVSVNGALSLAERRAVSDRRRAAVHRGVSRDDRREHGFNRGQDLVRVNDPLEA